MRMRGCGTAALVALVAVAAAPMFGQNFGMAKTKVVLQRKLPAMMTLPGNTIRVQVDVRKENADLGRDLGAQLETELLKDNQNLTEDDNSPDTTVYCTITNFAPPQTILIKRPGLNNTTVNYARITGALSVAFQARARSGRILGSDNVAINYDQEFDSSGDNASHGVLGSIGNSWHRLKGSKGNDDQADEPPTPSELRTLLLNQAVRQIAEHIVNTTESIDVFLAKNKGPMDEGDKDAEAGLWERALETYETASPLTKKDDDAYRLYDIGVANEALGYQASDTKSAMKFLDEAAIDYGKAIDAKPSEKYFLDPQKRIETALMHYRKLEEEKNAPPPPPPQVAAAPPPPPAREVAAVPTERRAGNAPAETPVAHKSTHEEHALTNSQVIAMVRAGMDDETVARIVRNSAAVDFDLSSVGRRRLIAGGVDGAVLGAMRTRAIQELANGK